MASNPSDARVAAVVRTSRKRPIGPEPSPVSPVLFAPSRAVTGAWSPHVWSAPTATGPVGARSGAAFRRRARRRSRRRRRPDRRVVTANLHSCPPARVPHQLLLACGHRVQVGCRCRRRSSVCRSVVVPLTDFSDGEVVTPTPRLAARRGCRTCGPASRPTSQSLPDAVHRQPSDRSSFVASCPLMLSPSTRAAPHGSRTSAMSPARRSSSPYAVPMRVGENRLGRAAVADLTVGVRRPAPELAAADPHVCKFPADDRRTGQRRGQQRFDTVAPLPSPICHARSRPQQKRLPAVVIPHTSRRPRSRSPASGRVASPAGSALWFMPFRGCRNRRSPNTHSSAPLRIPQLKSYPGFDGAPRRRRRDTAGHDSVAGGAVAQLSVPFAPQSK